MSDRPTHRLTVKTVVESTHQFLKLEIKEALKNISPINFVSLSIVPEPETKQFVAYIVYKEHQRA